ncbi:para-nitrobenzyl esterase [Stagonosporopsis vannaccii]|nr:para-nitrobenzyl esterase [Stagonosporopsis vannaccii]
MQAYRPRPGTPHRSITFLHPGLGALEGIVLPGDKVVQFHGIPYATIPRRFEQSQLLTDLDDTGRDFRYPGPACPHTFTMEDVYSGGLYPSESPILSDELRCLTVTLSVPVALLLPQRSASEQEQEQGATESQKEKKAIQKLPVLTYIHGGAFHVGKADAVHDTAPLVAQSIDDGQSVIAASLQYRLGAFGFLASPTGPLNLGLHDQRTGLRWLQRFISGFGGDETRVTVFGESAGGYSICYHMLGQEPLFNRAVIMSGVPGPLMVPISLASAEEEFRQICDVLGISERGAAALEILSSLPAQKLVEAGDAWVAKGNFWRPVIDPSFFAHESITWDTIPSLLAACPWVDALIVGNTAFEGTPYLSVAASLTPSALTSHMRAGLSEAATNNILDAYAISPSTDQALFTHAVTRWLGDIIFDAPIHALCRHLTSRPPTQNFPPHPPKETEKRKRLYRYLFDVGNPFLTSPLYRVPHHWVDVYFLFGTLAFRFPTQKLRDLSEQHGRTWVRFANGEAPWAEYGEGRREECIESGREGEGGGGMEKEGVFIVADEAEGWAQRPLRDDEARRERNWARLDRLWEAWGEQKGEPWLPLRLTEVMGMVKEDKTVE